LNRYILQQKFFTIKDRYEITDDRNQVRFLMRGKFFTIGKKFWLSDARGNDLYFVKQRLFRLLARYDVKQGDNTVGKIKKRLSLFTKRLKVTSDYGNYKVKGNVFAWDFKITDEAGNLVGNISKSILRIADRYTVDIYNNDAFILAVAVALDSIYHPKR